MRSDLHTCSRRARRRARHTAVYLNGENVSSRCTAFDTRVGWVRVYQVDDAGQIVVYDTPPHLRQRRLYGRVAARVDR